MATYTPPTADELDAHLAAIFNARQESPADAPLAIDRIDLANALDAVAKISTHLRAEMLGLSYDLRGPFGDRIEVVDDAYGLIIESITKAKKDYLTANE
jgi:hypothetical protein